MSEPEKSKSSSSDNTLAMLSHLLGIFPGFIGALIIYLTQKGEGYVKEQSKRALNFQLTILLAYIVAWILIFVIIGIFLFWAVYIANIIFCIMAAVAANQGENYHYPFSIKFVN